MQAMDNDVVSNSRPLSAEEVVALFQEYTPRRRSITMKDSGNRKKLLRPQRSVRFQLESPSPLSTSERDRWENELNQEYQMNQLLRYNRTPRHQTHISILNLHHRTKADHASPLPDDELLLKLSRQSVVDPKSLEVDSCELQTMKYRDDKDDVSFLFNLYTCLFRHHGHQSQCSHDTVLDFIRDIQSIGYLLTGGVVVTAYDLFVRLVQLDESVEISTEGTHFIGPVIGTHSGMLRAFPWFARHRGSFLGTWFPYDVGGGKVEPPPPVFEIDTSPKSIDQEILRPLQFGESVSCRFLDTSSALCDSHTEDQIEPTDVPVSTLFDVNDIARSVNIPQTVVRRGRFKPQPSCGDLQPDERLDNHSKSFISTTSSCNSSTVSRKSTSSRQKQIPNISRDITVVYEVNSCATGTQCEDSTHHHQDICIDAQPLPKKSHTTKETDTQSTAADSTWTFHRQEACMRNAKELPAEEDFDDYASWFHPTVDDNVTILTYSSSEEP